MKPDVCQAFCKALSIREMRNGFAIGTPYVNLGGDPLGFYALGPDAEGLFRLIDDGVTIPSLEAMGATLDSEARLAALSDLLKAHKSDYSEIERQLHMANVRPDNLANAALEFMALLLRVQDLSLMTRDRAENTFPAEVMEKLRDRFAKETAFREHEAVSEILSGSIPDVVIQAPDKNPVAVYIASTAQKISEAVFLQMAAMYEFRIPVRVVAILQDETQLIPYKLRQRADNYLDAVPRFAGEEKASLDRVAREVYGRDAMMSMGR